jgi:hypothetical protein
MPGAKTTCFNAGKNQSDQLSKRRWIHRSYSTELPTAVSPILIVYKASRHARTFHSLIILMQKIHLKDTKEKKKCIHLPTVFDNT